MTVRSLILLALATANFAFAAGLPADAVAAYERGRSLNAGGEGKADPAAARRAFEEAAAGGHPSAAVHLGAMFAHGSGGPRDEARAFQLFSQAAAAGSPEGHYHQGIFLLEGRGTRKDPAAAVAALDRAAQAGLVPAHVKLADLFYFGDAGVAKDSAKALPHAEAAATAGNGWACNLLGTMAEFGRGMETDRSAARHWYALAAEQGDAKAQANLGKLLLAGRPTDNDRISAYAWLKLSAQQGHGMAINLLAVHAPSLDPGLRAKGDLESERLSKAVAARNPGQPAKQPPQSLK